jgi:hypothetical protein
MEVRRLARRYFGLEDGPNGSLNVIRGTGFGEYFGGFSNRSEEG